MFILHDFLTQKVYAHEKRSLTMEMKSKAAFPPEDPILI